MTDTSRRAVALLLIVGLVGSVAIGGLAMVFASSDPDGLERVADDLGIASQEQPSSTSDSPFSDYETQGIGSDESSSGIALVVGLIVTAAVGFGMFRLLGAGRDTAEVTDATAPPRWAGDADDSGGGAPGSGNPGSDTTGDDVG